MLVLQQKRGDAVIITLTKPMPAGTRLEVTLVHAQDGKARIGYAADTSITIDREKIHRKKLAERDEPNENGDAAR